MATSDMADSLSERVRRRLRDEMAAKNLNQADVAGRLQWTQSRVSKLLNGKVDLRLEDVEALCFSVDISIVEVVRDHGLEFCAEMSPSELRILERLRQLPPQVVEALMMLLQTRLKTRVEDRYAKKPKPIFPPLKPRLKPRDQVE
jgi:transcriptional regulator with XRE-family HTH domain